MTSPDSENSANQSDPRSSRPPAATSATESADSQGGTTRTWPLWLAWLLLLGLLVAAAYYGWMQLEMVRKDSQREWLTESEMRSAIDSSSDRLQSRLDRAEDEIRQRESRLQDLQQRLNDLSSKILTEDPTGRTDWLLAEAEYLLRLANQRLNMEKDATGALNILQAADEVLAETEEPALYTVRQSVAREISQLRSVAKVDRVGIYLRLEAMIDQIESLDDQLFVKDSPLMEGLNEQAAAEQSRTGSDSAAETDWRQKVSQALVKLEKYFVIRHRDEPVEPLLAPDQVQYLQLNLRLMLEQAELALMEQNTELFRRSLGKAESWIQRYFVTNQPVTRSLLKELSELQQSNIAPQLPDIGNSLRQLKGVMERLYENKGVKASETSGESA